MIETIHQQQVPQGGIIRANKVWRNTGAAGTRDIYVFYGKGETWETFAPEFGAVATGVFANTGAQVTTPVDCQVPVDASLGLKDALVGVGSYIYPTIVLDDYEIVPNAIEVVAAGPAMVTVTLRALNPSASAAYWIAMCNTYPYSDYIPISQDIVWVDVLPSTPQDGVIFGAYNSLYQRLECPNCWHGVGFATPFEDGKIYYWDFSRGLLLDENFNPM